MTPILLATAGIILSSSHPNAPFIRENADRLTLDQLPSPSATTLPIEGSRKSQANHLLSDTPFPDQSLDETTLFATENGRSRTPYRRGIIGTLDLTLDPMIPPGHRSDRYEESRNLIKKKLDP
jgi:hypothetical protein